MKRIEIKVLTALLLAVLTFSLIPRSLQDAFGKESKPEPSWPMYQTYEDALSIYLGVLRAYSLPPAWDDRAHEGPPTHQAEAKLSETGHYF